MEFEEQISAFMDSALSPDEEADLLHILSVSPDKRALFHSHLATRRAFIADMQTVAVPRISTLRSSWNRAPGRTRGHPGGFGRRVVDNKADDHRNRRGHAAVHERLSFPLILA